MVKIGLLNTFILQMISLQQSFLLNFSRYISFKKPISSSDWFSEDFLAVLDEKQYI